MLAARGMHRAPSGPDLLIAALAELPGLIVFHVDKEFDLIAGISGSRWSDCACRRDKALSP
jgi:predicted nucleic acid-binding protein